MQLNLNEKKLPSAENLRLIANLCISLANKQSALEDKTVAPWESGKTYQKNVSYVSYNGYFYLCSVTNSDDEFTESHWEKLSDTISELTKADIEALVNLTPEQVAALQSLIDDDSITTTKTYSSSKIYAAIQDAIAECKDDTLKQIAKKVSGSYKIAATTADVISTDYIYLVPNNTTYDLYVLVDGTPTKVGDTTIDLSDYLKSADAESTYLKQTDAAGTYATITDADKKVDKINIVSDPNASSTNEQIVGAAKYYNDITNLLLKLIKNSNPYVAIDSPVSSNDFITRLYAGMEYLALQKRDSTNTSIIDNMSIAQFGVGFAYTIVTADDDLNDFTINSFLTVGANTANAPYAGANFMGISVAFADNISYAMQVLCDANENESGNKNRTIYIRHCYNNTWSDWYIVETSTTKNSYADITAFNSSDNYKITDTVNSYIEIKNGWAFIILTYVEAISAIPLGSSVDLLTGLPIPRKDVWKSFAAYEANSATIQAGIMTNGNLRIYSGTNGSHYRLSFSYPIADE